ncbi:hypothetical protein ABTM60_20440, partial [Acinetobacter baumannii]
RIAFGFSVDRTFRAGSKAAAPFLLVFLLTACAGLSEGPAAPTRKELYWVLSGADWPRAADEQPSETLASLMRVTPEMHRFAI